MRRPRLDPARPKVPEVAPLVDAVYARHGAGCCLHVVLDDGNCEDGSVRFCQGYARDQGHRDCVELADKLSQMSYTQRRKLSGRGWLQGAKGRAALPSVALP